MNTKEIQILEIQILDGPNATDLGVAFAHSFDKIGGDRYCRFTARSDDSLFLFAAKKRDFETPDEHLYLWVRIRKIEYVEGCEARKVYELEGIISEKCPIESLRGKPFDAVYYSSNRRGVMTVQL